MLTDPSKAAAAALARSTAPGYRKTSKMLAIYLDDVEELIRLEDDGRALALASLLPHIAAALESATLHASCEDANDWASRWLITGSSEADVTAAANRCHQGCTSERAQDDGAEHRGLRQLRLRRHPREALAGIPRPGLGLVPPAGSDARLALDLVGAAREWYTEFAVDDPLVQSNLARLAVLR